MKLFTECILSDLLLGYKTREIKIYIEAFTLTKRIEYIIRKPNIFHYFNK